MVKVLVVDTNLALEHARSIGSKGNKVYYFIDAKSPYPSLTDVINGYGFSEIEKVYDEGEVLDDVNLVVFTDIGYGAKADMLREKGYAVFGASRMGEELEKDRIYAKRISEMLGIGVTNYRVLKGVDELVSYLEREKDGRCKFFIKVNNWRGDIETFSVKDEKEAKLMLNQAGFGIFQDELEFVVEKGEEGIEIGADFWFNGKEFLDVHHFTIEVKGMGNIGKFVDDSIFREQFMDKLEEWLRRGGYRGMICIEGFWDGSEFKAMDYASRIPYPESVVMAKYIRNYDEVVIGVAMGEYVDVVFDKPYTGEVGVYTDVQDIWRVIDYPEKYENDVGFRKAVKKYGKVWYVPSDSLVATGSWNGDSWNEAITGAKKVAEEISAYSSEPSAGVLDYFEKAVKELRELGINVF